MAATGFWELIWVSWVSFFSKWGKTRTTLSSQRRAWVKTANSTPLVDIKLKYSVWSAQVSRLSQKNTFAMDTFAQLIFRTKSNNTVEEKLIKFLNFGKARVNVKPWHDILFTDSIQHQISNYSKIWILNRSKKVIPIFRFQPSLNIKM